jgi:hypothetical protein
VSKMEYLLASGLSSFVCLASAQSLAEEKKSPCDESWLNTFNQSPSVSVFEVLVHVKTLEDEFIFPSASEKELDKTWILEAPSDDGEKVAVNIDPFPEKLLREPLETVTSLASKL